MSDISGSLMSSSLCGNRRQFIAGAIPSQAVAFYTRSQHSEQRRYVPGYPVLPDAALRLGVEFANRRLARTQSQQGWRLQQKGPTFQLINRAQSGRRDLAHAALPDLWAACRRRERETIGDSPATGCEKAFCGGA